MPGGEGLNWKILYACDKTNVKILKCQILILVKFDIKQFQIERLLDLIFLKNVLKNNLISNWV